MKPKHKKNLKKLGRLLGTGVKKSGEFINNWGPKVHRATRRMSDVAMDAMAPRRTRTVVDLTAKRKPKRVMKGKKGFYLDFT